MRKVHSDFEGVQRHWIFGDWKPNWSSYLQRFLPRLGLINFMRVVNVVDFFVVFCNIGCLTDV